MKLKIEITMDNAAFTDCDDPGREAARILYEYGRRIEGSLNLSPGHSQPLRDLNGNEVGYAKVTI